MNKSNYYLVLEVIDSYNDERVMNDFMDRFVEGENISYEDYEDFCGRYIDDVSEGYYIRMNWKYIESDGDMSVYDNNDEEEDEE